MDTPSYRPITTLFVFLVSLGIYLSTLCPTMYWRDAPEFQVVGYQLGIAHPAGSPLYALIVKLYTFIPFGSIAFKTNLVSAFFAALLVSLTFLLMVECLGLLFPSGNKSLFILCGLLAASFCAVSNFLWQSSIMAEVYTLQNCFIVTLALLLVQSIKKNNQSFLYVAAFIFGLSTGAHIIMILYIPPLCLFLFLFYKKSLSLSQLGIIIMLVILGASIYFYLPARSSANPYYDWGNPETIDNFFTHVTDRKDARRHFWFSSEEFLDKLKDYGRYYSDDFSLLGILLGFVGIFILFKKNHRLFIGLGAFFFGQWWFFIRYWLWPSAFIGTFLFFALAMAVGIYYIVSRLQAGIIKTSLNIHRFYIITGAIVTACVIQVLFLGTLHLKTNTRSQYWSPYDFFHYVYNQIDFGGVLVDSSYYFGTSYLQQCENYRLDITNLFLSDVLCPRLFNSVTPARHPLITIPPSEETHLGEAIINANIMKRPFYWGPAKKFNHLVANNLQPYGLLFRVTPSPGPATTGALAIHNKKLHEFLSRFSSSVYQTNDSEEKRQYAAVLKNVSAFFYRGKEFYSAIAPLKVARLLAPSDISVLNGLGSNYASLGDFRAAESYFKKAYAIKPTSIVTLQNLGQLHLDANRYPEAFSWYQRLLRIDPQNPQASYGVGLYYEKNGNLHKAREAFQKVITLDSENQLASKARERLNSIEN